MLGGENATLTELFAQVQEAASVPPPRLHIPYPAAAAVGPRCSGSGPS